MEWYPCLVRSGRESRTRLDLRVWSHFLDLECFFGEVLVPLEWVGNKQQKLYPGYLFIEMILNTETYWLVRNLPMVMAFGEKEERPDPIHIDHINRMVSMMVEKPPESKIITYKCGDLVDVIKGLFEGFRGTVVRFSPPKVIVWLSIMGRRTETQLDVTQVKHI